MDKLIYVNTPAAGIITKEGKELLDQFHVGQLSNPEKAYADLEQTGYYETKDLVSTFLGAPKNEIAFIPNFSFGLSGIIASILPTHNSVLLYEGDYPSVNLPFELNKFDISYIPSVEFSTEIILSALSTTKAKVLSISHVQYMTGYMIDAEVIGQKCKELGILFILDCTQSMGVFNYDFSSLTVDVIIGSNYKWMNGGYGSGTMCCKQEFITKFSPVFGGRNSFRMINDEFLFKRDIHCYEPGHLPFHNLLLLNGALKVKLEIGKASIEAHSKNLVGQFIKHLDHDKYNLIGASNIEARVGIISIQNQKGLVEYLAANQVIAVERGEYLRFGFHYHNSESEIKSICELLNRH
ncbi:MAG: cysteine desulfurase/selenocysteine lyase [Parvicellaceae bacterium]|jgi:cysteine desulfurase/selenocysteine lyase